MSDLPPSPGSGQAKENNSRPEDLNADLKTMAMAGALMEKLGTPSDVTKVLVVRKAIFASLNHTPENRTGYDSSLRVALYDQVEKGSVNVNGKYFNAIMAFLMKPKYIIQGMPQQQSNFEDDQPGFISRAWSRLTGKDPKPASNNNGQAKS